MYKLYFNIVVIVIILIIGVATGYFILIRENTETSPAPQRQNIPVQEIVETSPISQRQDNLLIFLKDDDSIWITDFTKNNQAIKIVDALPTDRFLKASGGSRYINNRYWDLSPNGDQIVFDLAGGNDNFDGIAIASTSHYAPPKFLHRGSRPKWSPVNDSILFEDENKIKLFSFSDSKIKIFEGVNELPAPYLWFKDGTNFLAFNRTHTNEIERYIINKNTGEKRLLEVPELKKMKGNITSYYPIISPVANEFIAEIYYEKGYDVAVFNTDRQFLKIVSPLPTESWPGSGHLAPNWSPDGNRISYIDNYCDINSGCPSKKPISKLIIANKDGSEKQIIVDGAFPHGLNNSISMPCWLTSGKEIVFLGTDTKGVAGILFVVDLESKEVKQITQDYVAGFLCSR